MIDGAFYETSIVLHCTYNPEKWDIRLLFLPDDARLSVLHRNLVVMPICLSVHGITKIMGDLYKIYLILKCNLEHIVFFHILTLITK